MPRKALVDQILELRQKLVSRLVRKLSPALKHQKALTMHWKNLSLPKQLIR